MEDVEIRIRRSRKMEERPKPVLDSHDLGVDADDSSHNNMGKERCSDRQEMMHDVRSEQDHSSIFYNDGKHNVIGENSDIQTKATTCPACNVLTHVNGGSHASYFGYRGFSPTVSPDASNIETDMALHDNGEYDSDEQLHVLDQSCLADNENVEHMCTNNVVPDICLEEKIVDFTAIVETTSDNVNKLDPISIPEKLSDAENKTADPVYFENVTQQDSNENAALNFAKKNDNGIIVTTRGDNSESETGDNVTGPLDRPNSGENIYVSSDSRFYTAVIKSQVTEDDHIYISQSDHDIPIRTITLPDKKDFHKAGYLQKQGGVDRNQGWKKRWFTFDAKALKYYRDQKSSVSLRIIPVALMRSVSPANETVQKSRSSAPVTDLFSASGRQHQFTLECKQRTFLFGTDSIENCQQWQSSLMAAIIEYQKCGVTDLPYGGEMNSPDISGMAKFDNCKTKYFVALKGGILRYYHNLEDYSVDCPIHELSMERTSVKEVRKSALQLDSPPDQKFVLQFEQASNAIQWKTYIETAIYRALGDDTVVNRVREKEDNRTCADCNSPEAEWASINLGIVICTRCTGPHRSMGVKRSKVRSLRMDNLSKANENILQLLEAIGNKNGNQFWFKNSEEVRVIDDQTPDIIRQKHIEEKYLKKKYADLLQFNTKEELNMALYSAVKTGNIIAAMVSLFSGADINFKCQEQSKTVLDIANETCNEVMKEFLEQNKNTDVTVIQPENSKEEAINGTGKKTAIYHEGYLDKTGPNLKGFLRRWCVLHYGRITYFSDKQGSEKGFVDLADTASVSIVTGQRQYSFDIQTKSRTYRFAAKDETSLGKWLNVVIQVISPFDFEGLDRILAAGYFYFKKQLKFWAKVWLVLQENALHFRQRDDSDVHTIEISRHMKCLQYNLGKHSEKEEDVIKQLDGNQTIELISSEGHVVAYLQGMTLKDTRKLCSLLEAAINGHS